jgi:uncharacterized membrane protein
MKALSYSLLRPAAEDALEDSKYSPKKLVLIHTGVCMVVGLVLSVITYVLDLGIAQTGGLSGIGNRVILQSVQAFLSVASSILLPFWEIGYIFAALQFARRQSPDTHALFAGLRHWGVVLRGLLLKAGVIFAVMFMGCQVSFSLYMMSPAGAPLYALSTEMTKSGVTDPMVLMENEAYMELMLNAVPFILIGAMVLLIPVLYLLRFADYVMMDQPELGALYAIVSSFHMTRRHFKALFKLDLRFWWYYALELLVVVISYGHMILDLAGVDIGIGGDTAMFVFYIVSLAGQLGLYVWKKNTVFTTYALAYDIIYLPSASVKKQEN